MPSTVKARQGQGATRTFQGQTVPAEAVNPKAFFANTRRRRYMEKSQSFAGFGQTQVFELLKSDIISMVRVRFIGSLVLTLNGGTIATTMRWPYDLPARLRFTANGQTNLINASGAKFKLRNIQSATTYSDRGVNQTVAGATVNQGTLSLASESWGVGAGSTALAAGTYDVELVWDIPVAEDDKDLTGAIFAQTTAMDLNVAIDWQLQSQLFVTTGAPTISLTGMIEVETEKFSIPVVGNSFVVPDMSTFHSMVQGQTSSLQTGDNDIRITGQGIGKTVLRLSGQLWNGATPAPLVVNQTNFGPQGWRYGTQEGPEIYPDGRSLRQWNEELYSSDIGSVFGFFAHDFATKWAFRDAVDMGQASELRIYMNIAAALTNPNFEYVQELVFPAGAAA